MLENPKDYTQNNNFTNYGTIGGSLTTNIQNKGNIDNFINHNLITKSIFNGGHIKNFINNGVIKTGGKSNYAIMTNSTITNFINTGTIESGVPIYVDNNGVISDLKNRGQLIFIGQNRSNTNSQILTGSSAEVNITEWKITIDKSAAEYNDISKVDLTNGNANHLDRIIVSGNSTQNIKFADGAIKLEAGANFKLGEEYKLENVVLINSSGTAQVAGSQINGGVPLSGKNFIDGNPNDMIEFKFKDNDTTINQNNAYDPKNPPQPPVTPTNPSNPNPPVNPPIDPNNPNNPGGNPNNPGGGSVIADINTKKAISATLNQSLSNESVRRANFVQSVVANAINSVSNLNLSYANLDLSKFDFSNELYANLRSDIILDNVLKNARKTPNFHTFVLPYYNYTDSKSAKTNSYGIIAGINKDYENLGIFGLYLGVEKANTEANFTQEFNDNSFYFGLNHFKEIYADENKNAYFKTLIHSGFTRSKISRNNINSDKANLYSIGASFNAGMNFYLNAQNILNPEFGLEFLRYRAGSFKIENEKYLENYFTLIQPKFAMNYNFLASENLALNLQGGFKLNLDKNIENSVIINQTKINSKTSLNSFYGFGEIGLSYDINAKTSLSLNYNLLKSSDLDSHTGYLRLDFRF